jgi:hypothetical protein
MGGQNDDCLPWMGALVWNPDKLELASKWSSDGPVIPIEFARQSDNGRITLVITDGTPAVLWAELAAPGIGKAKEQLALREGISARNISRGVGYWTPNNASSHSEAPVIGNWAKERSYDGVVWTALQPRFAGEYRVPTEAEVLEYLASLTGQKRTDAETYFRRAPTRFGRPTARPLKPARDGYPHPRLVMIIAGLQRHTSSQFHPPGCASKINDLVESLGTTTKVKLTARIEPQCACGGHGAAAHVALIEPCPAADLQAN